MAVGALKSQSPGKALHHSLGPVLPLLLTLGGCSHHTEEPLGVALAGPCPARRGALQPHGMMHRSPALCSAGQPRGRPRPWP